MADSKKKVVHMQGAIKNKDKMTKEQFDKIAGKGKKPAPKKRK